MKYISNIRKWGVRKTLSIARAYLYKYLFVFRENLLNKGGRETFSQYAEDLFIDRFLKYPNKGFYVDIGANNPKYLNNTRRFYEKGWVGINIEPDLNNFRLLEQSRSKDININAGVSKNEGQMVFYVCEKDTLSTFSKDTAEKLSSEGHRILEEKLISVSKLSSILQNNSVTSIDFMTIDTEGHDKEVLESNNWEIFRPRIICIEDNEGNEHDKFFKKINYRKIGFNGLNSFFADNNKI